MTALIPILIGWAGAYAGLYTWRWIAAGRNTEST